MRTLIPSIPLARKAMVGSCRRRHRERRCGGPGASARPDSLLPQVRSTRLTMTAPPRPAAAMRRLQVGEDGPAEHLVHLVGHAGQGVDHLVAHRADEPGGRAHGLGDERGPHGARRPGGRCSRAWPGPATRTSRRSSRRWPGRGPRATFMTSAMASRVMSSWVGPSPPHTTTPSLRASAVRRASTIRSWLSPTAWWKWESTPAAPAARPATAELVSAIWPSSSSVPTATISTLISGDRPAGPGARRPGTAPR